MNVSRKGRDRKGLFTAGSGPVPVQRHRGSFVDNLVDKLLVRLARQRSQSEAGLIAGDDPAYCNGHISQLYPCLSINGVPQICQYRD